METTEINNQESGASSRRHILKTAALSAGLMLGGALIGSAAHADTKTLTYHDIPEPGYLNLFGIDGGYDVKVLNYALLLEDLESDLYLQALQRLTIGGTNEIGTTIPGLNLSLTEPDVFFINEIAPVEAEHRDFLRGSLNGLIDGIAIRRYKHDFGIETKSRQEVLGLVLLAERTGTAAYLGAVPKLRTRAFITAAAAIQGTEARHTATLQMVENILYNGSNPKPVAPLASDNHGIDTPVDPNDVLAQVSPFIVT